MHRTIGYLSKRFARVRPGEGRKVLLTFLYFFLVITAYYLIKPVSRSLVLGELGSRMVPYIDLICAGLMGPVVTLFARMVDRVSKPRLVSGSFWLIIGLLLLFWRMLDWPAAWVAGAFYVWVAMFSVLVVTLFWLVANDLYRPREAKRLFGFVGSGGILGGIVGSSIAAVGAQVIGTERLLLLSAGVLILCWLVVRQLWAYAPERGGESAAPLRSRSETFLSDVGQFARLIIESRYLMLLIAMVGLNKLIATLIYYQLNPFIEQTFPDQDAKTTFTGIFFGAMNVLSFVIQFFFTSWVLRRLGLFVALTALPIGLLVGTTGMLLVPVFWLAAATELFDGSMNYSLQQTTKELLYLPIDRSIRYKVKPFIDMVVFRFGKGIAAIIGIVTLSALGLSPRLLTYLTVPLVVAWLVVAVWLRRDYVTAIRTILQARAAARRQPASPAAAARAPDAPKAPAPVGEPDSGEPTASEAFGSLLSARLAPQKLALMARLLASKDPASAHAKQLLEELEAYEAHPAGPPEPQTSLHRLTAVIGDHTLPMARRRQAVRWLARSPEQAAVDYLFGMVLVEGDATLRHEAVRGLLRLRLQKTRLEFPVTPIRRQIAYEVATHQRILRVGTIYRQHHRSPVDPNDPVLALLRVLLEESIEQVFRLLMLLYRPEDIHLVYEQLRAPDRYIRADAVELLDNLVDSGMRAILAPVLDEDRFLAMLEESAEALREPAAAYQLLQGAIWDHDSWLSVTTLCAVGRLRLTNLRAELERAARHQIPVVSTAAKVALHFTTTP